MGTPEEFEAIIDSGFAGQLRVDYWYGHHGIKEISDEEIDKEKDPVLKDLLQRVQQIKRDDPNPFEDNVEFLSGGTSYDKNYRANFTPSGRCNLLTEDNLCTLHELGLKPEQGRKACCNDDINEAEKNLYYVNLWATDKGREVLDKFKKIVGIS
jgi:hypothetical protein